ncbi:hypothetical protein BH23CYA1_BH23CYA1_17580 [soil metagenome]
MSRPPQPSICLPNKAVNNSGLTLIECLVAIAVIGLTAAVMAPVMVFSVATRIQSQRAEQALQIAQGEVDQIRLMAERGGDFSSALASYPITSFASVAMTNPPKEALTYSLDSTTTNNAKKVDIGNGTTNRFAVQVFRSVGSTPAGSTLPIAFDVGVRVYDLNAVNKYGSTSSLRKDAASLNFTSGEGQRSTRPLAVIYTSIFQGDRDGALCTYRLYLDSAASTTGLDCN